MSGRDDGENNPVAGVERLGRPPRQHPSRSRGHEREARDSALESFVDVHAFAPGELARAARESGLENVRVTGEELFANWFGWTNRTLEATAEPEDVPWAWRQYAYRGYLLFQDLDRRLFEGRLPAALFYNLMITARRG